MDIFISTSFIISWIQSSIRLSTPFLLAGLGETISEKAGIVNIGLEGIMLIGAFFSFTVALYSGSIWLGIISAILLGMLVGVIFGVACVFFKANQLVVGLAVNMFAIGITGFLYRTFVSTSSETIKIEILPALKIPLLCDIPILGPALFNHNIYIYLSILLVPFTQFFLRRTHLGLSLRSVGEHPRAADTLGIRVDLMRFWTVVVCCGLAGLAGSYLSTAHANTFVELMSGGRGFISLAVVVLGKWNPFGVLLASLLFGTANSIQLRLQSIGYEIPYHLFLMIPYVITILAVIGAGGQRNQGPRALGSPYKRS